MKPLVLVTRPRPDADTLARQIEDRGFSTLIEPLMTVRPLTVQLPDPDSYRALVFTSANAVRVFAGLSENRAVPVYCAGDHTADTARALGWTNVVSAKGNGAALSGLLAQTSFKEDSVLLHPAGRDIAGSVTAGTIAIKRLDIYKAEKTDALSPSCLNALDRNAITAALFFSARTGRIFSDLLRQGGRTDSVSATKALCLADSVVESVGHLPWKDVQVANHPDRHSLLALL